MSGAGRRGAAAALAVAAAVAVGCGIPSDDEPTLASPEEVPFELLDPTGALPTTSTTAPQPATTEVLANRAMCLFDGGILVEVPVRLRPGSGLAGLLEVLTDPPPGAEDLATAVPDPDLVTSVRVVAGIADVDLAGEFAAIPAAEQRRIVEQLVCSLTAQPGVGRVAFTLDGEPVEVPTADGSLTAQPVSRDDYPGRIRTG